MERGEKREKTSPQNTFLVTALLGDTMPADVVTEDLRFGRETIL